MDKQAQAARAAAIDSSAKAQGLRIQSQPIPGVWRKPVVTAPKVKFPAIENVPKDVQEIAFINELGQTLNPGDWCIAVTTGYARSLSIRRARYVGVRWKGRQQWVVIRATFKKFDYAQKRYVEHTRLTTLRAGRVYPTT